MFSVPLLLNVSLAVIHRLSPASTDDAAPFAGQTTGYDDDFQEPVVYADDRAGGVTVRETARIELPPIRVPCQFEPVKLEELRQRFSGDMPSSHIQLVLHRQDLTLMKLIDTYTGAPLLKVNDRVERLEARSNPGKSTIPFKAPGLYIFEISPASAGFGDAGHDLYLAFLHERERVLA